MMSAAVPISLPVAVSAEQRAGGDFAKALNASEDGPGRSVDLT